MFYDELDILFARCSGRNRKDELNIPRWGRENTTADLPTLRYLTPLCGKELYGGYSSAKMRKKEREEFIAKCGPVRIIMKDGKLL